MRACCGFGLLLASMAVTACGGTATSPPHLIATTAPTASPTASPIAANDLLVATSGVIEYGPTGTTPIASFTPAPLSGDPDQDSQAIAVDAVGNIFLADSAALDEFAPVSHKVTRVISSGIDDPTALALDSHGDVFVGNYGRDPGNTGMFSGASVEEFAPGATTPSRTIASLLPASIAVDTSGNLYVDDGHTLSVSVFPPGGVTATSTITPPTIPGSNTLYGQIAVDSSGDLYVYDTFQSVTTFVTQSVVYEYAPGSSVPVRTIAVPEPVGASAGDGAAAPGELAFDSANNVYVGNDASDYCHPSSPITTSSVSEYAAGTSTTPIRTIGGLELPQNLVVDRSGNLYVSDGCKITLTEYAAGTTHVVRILPLAGSAAITSFS